MGRYHVPLATALYAVNVAVVSIAEAITWWVARADRLIPAEAVRPTLLARLPSQLLPPAVFLASVPIAYLASPTAANLC